MTSRSSRSAPLLPLLVLTAAVLLAHIALLQSAPMGLGLSPPRPSLAAFSTRAIDAVPAPQKVDKSPLTPPLVPLPKSPPAKTVTEKPAPSPSTAPVSDAGAIIQPPPAVAAVEPPSPAPPSTTERPATTDQASDDPRPPDDPTNSVKAYAVPGSMRFKYKVETNKFPYSLNAELLWQQSADGYEARLEYSAFGQSRIQTSRGRITPQGLAPLRFSDKYRSEVAAHFNHEKNVVTFSANTPDVPLLAGAQDRLSVLIQLASMIAGDPGHYPPATTIAIQTIGPRDAATWLFTVEGERKIALPGGEMLTLKLLRNPRQEFDQKVELWLAPNLGYLPVRIQITEPNGDSIDQKLLTFEPQS